MYSWLTSANDDMLPACSLVTSSHCPMYRMNNSSLRTYPIVLHIEVVWTSNSTQKIGCSDMCEDTWLHDLWRSTSSRVAQTCALILRLKNTINHCPRWCPPNHGAKLLSGCLSTVGATHSEDIHPLWGYPPTMKVPTHPQLLTHWGHPHMLRMITHLPTLKAPTHFQYVYPLRVPTHNEGICPH